MNAKTIRRATLALLPAALLTLTSCSSTPTPPPDVGAARLDYTPGVPGGAITQTFKTSATVTAIDQAQRTATLLGSNGKKFTVKVGPEAVNFDQVRVGDRVNATVAQKIVAYLDKNNIAAGSGSAAALAQSSKGGQPGGLTVEATQVIGRIVAIDMLRRTGTLLFEDGTTQILPIRNDVDPSRFKVGQQVVFQVTELNAVWVEKPQ